MSVNSPYFSIFLFFMVISAITLIMFFLPRLFATFKYERHKGTQYECGFDALENSFNSFDIRFYLVGILFIIFDVEVIFMLPWALSLGTLGMTGFFSMMCFLFILAVGFVYELVSGALEWS